jgi:hypothetical protein
VEENNGLPRILGKIILKKIKLTEMLFHGGEIG